MANRSLIAYLAAANLFTKDHLEVPENKALMQKARYYYISVSHGWDFLCDSSLGGLDSLMALRNSVKRCSLLCVKLENSCKLENALS